MEWCLDGYHAYTLEARPGDGERRGPRPLERVVRGATQDTRPADARSARRNRAFPEARYVGVRPARPLFADAFKE